MADEQVGNNSYITMTPGSAAAGQLQNILTQKRLEARQAMLDQIHAKDVESQIRDRDENAKSQAEYRAAYAESRKAQATQRIAGLYSPDQDMDPSGSDYQELMQSAPNLIKPAEAGTAPLQDGDQGPTKPAVGPKFRGLPVQIETARKAQREADAQKSLDALSDDPAFNTADDAHKVLMIAKLYPQVDPSAMMERLLTNKNEKSGGRILLVDEASKKVYDQSTGKEFKGPTGPNDKVINIPVKTPPQPPAVTSPGNDAEGNPVFIGSRMRPNGTPMVVDIYGNDYVGKITPKGKATVKPIQIPGPVSKQLGILKGALTPKPSAFSWLGVGPSEPDPAVVNDFHQQQAITAMNAVKDQSPEFQALVQHILHELADPKTQQNLSDDQIVKHYVDTGVKLSDDEQNNLKTLLGAIR